MKKIKSVTKNIKERFNTLSKSKKVLIVVSSVIVLVLGISIPTTMVMSNDSVDQKEVASKNTSKKESKKKVSKKEDTKKEEVEESDDADEEEIDTEEDNEEEVVNTNSNSNNSASNNNARSNANSGSTSSGSSNTGSVAQSQPVQQAPVREQTAWEKLGISEYEYYNATSEGVQADFPGSDLSVCNNEGNRLMNTYDRVWGTQSYTVRGKYTREYKGCGLKVNVDGTEYSYSQARSILGF